MSGDWRLQLFSIQHIFCFDMRNFRFRQRHPEILFRTQRNLFFVSIPDSLAAHFLPLCKICTVAKFCRPHCNSFRACSSRPFELFAPITTAISRRCPSTADAIRLYPAPDVCPVLSPSICMVLSHNKPLRFCCVMPFQVRLFSLYM